MPPLWYTQGPARAGVRPEREGPFTRDAVLKIWLRGDLEGDVLVWTNEKLFPSTDRRSNKVVRVNEWRRWVELPDPMRRRLEAEASAKHVEEEPAAPKEADVPEYSAADDPYSAANYLSVNAPTQSPPLHNAAGDGAGFGDSNKI